jgi:hypothetical protein
MTANKGQKGTYMMDQLDQFIVGLDRQQPDWWITFADQQDARRYMRATWTLDGKLADAAHIARVRDSLRRTVAQSLMLGARAAIFAGLCDAKEEAR